jgi:hypothetical protein
MAEKIFRGGTIITMDDRHRQVEAVATAGGRIIAAGEEGAVLKTKTRATKIVDLGGRTLKPSFMDSQDHFMNAPRIVTWANVSGPSVGPITMIADFVPVLQARVKKHKVRKGHRPLGLRFFNNRVPKTNLNGRKETP